MPMAPTDCHMATLRIVHTRLQASIGAKDALKKLETSCLTKPWCIGIQVSRAKHKSPLRWCRKVSQQGTDSVRQGRSERNRDVSTHHPRAMPTNFIRIIDRRCVLTMISSPLKFLASFSRCCVCVRFPRRAAKKTSDAVPESTPNAHPVHPACVLSRGTED